jgi:hypothetical protein
MPYAAESARPGTDISSDHEGGDATREAFTHVGAFRAQAYGIITTEFFRHLLLDIYPDAFNLDPVGTGRGLKFVFSISTRSH